MNVGRTRSVRPSKISEILAGHMSSDSDTQEEPYITTPDNKTVDEALTLVDDYGEKFSTCQRLFIPDSGDGCASNSQGISHVPHQVQLPVPQTTDVPKSKNPSEDGRKGKRKKKKKKRRYGELMAYARAKKNKTYICKPETGCQGKGIFVTKNVRDMKPHDRLICQVYISKPFLVDGFKFDLRIYALITSCDPLRIYVYNDGLARFATSRYREPTAVNISNVFMHLTNYAVNKHSRTYVVDDEAGSKRKISTLTNWLVNKEYDVEELLGNIDDVIIKTVIAAHPILKHSYHACFPSHDFTYACFELLGFDVLLDYKLKPYILEVNHSPSFHTDAQIDRDIKESLLQDTFIILNLTQTDKKKIVEEDRRRVRERLLQGINHKDNEIGSCASLKDPWKAQVAWEESHMGNFRCIYPQEDCEKYEPFFLQTQSSLFQDTAASRAREECARLQREELEGKTKAETARRAMWRSKESEKLQPESPSGRDRLAAPPVKKKMHIPMKKPVAEKKQYCLNSFEPEPIIEAEERERSTAMAQREFLLKSFGITEQIVQAMKKNGTLRLEDEKKLRLHPEAGDCKLPSMFPNSNKPHISFRINRNNFLVNPSPPVTNCEHNVPVSTQSSDRLQTLSCSIPLQPLAGLSITCNNAPIVTRPHIPRSIWLDDKDRDIRFTKTHMARSLTNTFKLQELEKRELQRQFQNE